MAYKRYFNVDTPSQMRDEVVRLLDHMSSNHRDHRRFATTKKLVAQYDAIIGILEGLSETLRTAEISPANIEAPHP